MSGAPARRRAGDFARSFLTEWREDRVPDLAAGVAFYAVLSLLPGVLAVAAVLGVLDAVVGEDLAVDVQEEVLDFLGRILTSEADATLDATRDLFTEARPGLLTFSLLVALWTTSRGFAALVRALDVVYDLDEHRPWIRIRTTAVLLAVGSTFAGALMLSLLIIGPLFGTGEDIANEIGLGDQFVFLWDVFRLPLAFVLLVLWAATVFHVGPDHRTRWRADLPGAVVTGVLWIAFSGALHVYVQVAQTGNAVFGALGGALIVLLWFWLLALALMIGGEVNQLLLPSQSALVERGAEGPDEVAGVDRAAPVEEDAHDGGGDHHPV